MASPPDYRAIAAQKAQQYGVPVDVFLRQIAQESGFNPSARSGAGAQGIAQFMPATAREYGVNTADPVSSLDGAARMDAGLIKKYGIAGALSAYNSGNPNAYKDPNFAHGQTYNYVRSILGGQQGSGGAGVASSPVPPAAAGQPDRSALMKALLGASSSGDYSGFFNAVAKSRQAPTPSVSPVAAAMAPQSGGKAGGFLAATAAYTPRTSRRRPRLPDEPRRCDRRARRRNRRQGALRPERVRTRATPSSTSPAGGTPGRRSTSATRLRRSVPVSRSRRDRRSHGQARPRWGTRRCRDGPRSASHRAAHPDTQARTHRSNRSSFLGAPVGRAPLGDSPTSD